RRLLPALGLGRLAVVVANTEAQRAEEFPLRLVFTVEGPRDRAAFVAITIVIELRDVPQTRIRHVALVGARGGIVREAEGRDALASVEVDGDRRMYTVGAHREELGVELAGLVGQR